MKSKEKVVAGRVYQIKVTLKDVKPAIWRIIQISDNSSLAKLHRTLQASFGLTDTHLHQFIIGGKYYGIPNDEEPVGETISETRVKLADVIGENVRFFYEYDFGDGWEYELLVEKVLPQQQGSVYPLCLGGERSGPPEDCGGPFGYLDLLKILKNPRHPEHEARKEWVGDYFSPEVFDKEETNEILGRLR